MCYETGFNEGERLEPLSDFVWPVCGQKQLPFSVYIFVLWVNWVVAYSPKIGGWRRRGGSSEIREGPKFAEASPFLATDLCTFLSSTLLCDKTFLSPRIFFRRPIRQSGHARKLGLIFRLIRRRDQGEEEWSFQGPNCHLRFPLLLFYPPTFVSLQTSLFPGSWLLILIYFLVSSFLPFWPFGLWPLK